MRLQKKFSLAGKAVLLVLLLTAALVVVSDSAPQRQGAAAQLRFAAIMPKGALLYAQSRDLAGQFNLWRNSTAHNRYFGGKNYESLQQDSRLFLKLQSRAKEFEAALGVEFTEENIASWAGGASAIALYDLGKLEMVIVSEMPRPKAFATVFFANAKNFDERTASGGAIYYVREFAADGGQMQQRVAFAYSDGKIILASSEGLLQRALENIANRQSGDRLSEETNPTIAKANGFAPHDVTLWLNQTKLNQNLYFRVYWIHRNLSDLKALQTGLIDLEITQTDLKERRWFVLNETNKQAKVGVKGEQLAGLLRFAPQGAQLMEARVVSANDNDLIDEVAETVFGRIPTAPKIDADPPRHSDGSSDRSDKEGRYRYLDGRFDKDIDDEAATKLTNSANEPAAAMKRFAEALKPILTAAKPQTYVVLQAPQVGAGQAFVKFNRAVVIDLGNATALSAAQLENVIADEMQNRFIVGNVGQRLRWQVEGAVHSLRQALLEQGGAYAINGKSLVIANSKEYCAAIIAAGATPTTYTAQLPNNLLRYAVARPALAKPAFTKLTKTLDAAQSVSAINDGSGEPKEGDDETAGPIYFFSGNIASLIETIDGFGEATFETAMNGDVLQEVVIYRLN